MKFGSVCSGIEAASVAWEPIGMKTAWFAEIEPFPSAVLAHHWPHVPNLGDMTQIRGRVASGEVEAPDLLVGGTPCQAFSVAGLRNSLDDDRGQLTLEYVRLADAIDERRATDGLDKCVIVWENVPGVLTTKDNAFGCFLGALAGEDSELQPAGKKWSKSGCVFGPKRAIAWRVLDAQYFGVAQRRRRVFVVASARNGFDPTKILFEYDSVRRDTAPSRKAREEIAGNVGESTEIRSHWDGELNPHPTLSQSHNTGGIGQSNQEIFSQRGAGLVHGFRMTAFGEYADDDSASTMKARDYKDATDLAVSVVHGTQDPCNSTELAFALGRNSGQENAVFGIPGNWIGRKPENGGNAVEPMSNISPCLTSTDRHGIAAAMQVRRLTPTECERLQGFPDGHTAIEYKGKPAPDGQRYKALGNSMAVPCMAWLGKRIKEVEALCSSVKAAS